MVSFSWNSIVIDCFILIRKHLNVKTNVLGKFDFKHKLRYEILKRVRSMFEYVVLMKYVKLGNIFSFYFDHSSY